MQASEPRFSGEWALYIEAMTDNVQMLRNEYPTDDSQISPRDRVSLHLHLALLIEECTRFQDKITAPETAFLNDEGPGLPEAP